MNLGSTETHQFDAHAVFNQSNFKDKKLNVDSFMELNLEVKDISRIQILTQNRFDHVGSLPELPNIKPTQLKKFELKGGPIYQELFLKPLSYSSLFTSKFISWRNSEVKLNGISLTVKLAGTFALPLLTLSALVETAVYNVLIFSAKVLKPISEKPQNYVEKKRIVDLKDSSYFTISWTISMLSANLAVSSLPDDEDKAKLYLKISAAAKV